MASKHVENLEKMVASLRVERRNLAAHLAKDIRRDTIVPEEVAQFGELQRAIEAVTNALKDETAQAEIEAADADRVRMANKAMPE